MSWFAVVATAAAAWFQKYLGYLVPERLVAGPRARLAAALVPVGLLAALIAVSTLTTDGSVVVDARIAGLGAATVALILRAPFLLVLVVAAATAALIRALGLSA